MSVTMFTAGGNYVRSIYSSSPANEDNINRALARGVGPVPGPSCHSVVFPLYTDPCLQPLTNGTNSTKRSRYTMFVEHEE